MTPKQLNELPTLKVGDLISAPNGSQWAITSIVSNLFDDDGEGVTLIFEITAATISSVSTRDLN